MSQILRLENLTDCVILYEESKKNNIGTGDLGRHVFYVDFQWTSLKMIFQYIIP